MGTLNLVPPSEGISCA